MCLHDWIVLCGALVALFSIAIRIFCDHFHIRHRIQCSRAHRILQSESSEMCFTTSISPCSPGCLLRLERVYSMRLRWIWERKCGSESVTCQRPQVCSALTGRRAGALCWSRGAVSYKYRTKLKLSNKLLEINTRSLKSIDILMIFNLGAHKYTFYSKLTKNWGGGHVPPVFMRGRPCLLYTEHVLVHTI